jgi:hypothetical protein
MPGEVKGHLQDGISDLLVDCQRKFGRWARDQITLPSVALPGFLSNRRGDNWRPLFRIAALVGGNWPAKIEAAARAAMSLSVSSDVIIAFLADAREVIGQRDRILTSELLEALKAKEDPSWDWNACHRGGPVNAFWLRDALADVLIPPGSRAWKAGGHVRRGYTADQFDDAYRRYLPAHPENMIQKPGISGISSAPSATGMKKHSQTQEISPVADDEEGQKRYPQPAASATDTVADGSGSGYQTGPSPSSATAQKGKQDKHNYVPVADGADQKRRKPTSRIESPETSNGKVREELW